MGHIVGPRLRITSMLEGLANWLPLLSLIIYLAFFFVLVVSILSVVVSGLLPRAADVPALVHMTSVETKKKIKRMILPRLMGRSSIYAVNSLLLVQHKGTFSRMIRIMVLPRYLMRKVRIPEAARPSFQQADVIGFYTWWIYSQGHYYLPYRKLVLRTGRTACSDVRRLKRNLYGPDVVFYAIVGYFLVLRIAVMVQNWSN